jgi:hypothetical protein
MSHPTRHLLIVFFAAVIFAATTTNVRASCGDYLLHERTSTDRLAPADFPSEFSVSHDGEPPAGIPVSRCRNGGCRRGPSVPPAPSTPVPPTFFKMPVGLKSSASDVMPSPAFVPFVGRDAIAPDQFLVWEIEHPPRPLQ